MLCMAAELEQRSWLSACLQAAVSQCVCLKPLLHQQGFVSCVLTWMPHPAGYGRKEAAQQLLDAGAQPAPLNQQGQTPSDAAKQNREMHMVTFLQSRSKTETNTYL